MTGFDVVDHPNTPLPDIRYDLRMGSATRVRLPPSPHQLTSPLSAVATSLAWRRLASEPSPNIDGSDSAHSSSPRVTAMPPKSRDRRSHESRDSRSPNRSTLVWRPSMRASRSSRAPDIDRVSRTDETDRPSSSSMATTSSADS